MVENKQEESTINALMNIDDFMGEHIGSTAPTLYLIGVSAIPVILYIFILRHFIPLGVFLVFELLFIGRMALYFLGNENKLLEIYLQSLNDEYAIASDLVRVAHLHEDGLLEYENGKVAYILSGFAGTYFDKDSYSVALESFLKKLEPWTFDISCHLVVDEFRLQDRYEGLLPYVDKDLLWERIQLYRMQDKFCRENTTLYRINFMVKCPKYDWKKLRKSLEDTVHSTDSSLFYNLYICDKEQANDVLSRDICIDIDLEQMLLEKYKSTEYKGSGVLYYDNDIPEKLKPRVEKVNLEGRRISYLIDNK